MRLFLRDADGRRPVFGDDELFQHDPHWRDHVLVPRVLPRRHGRGLGASHQTGWTGAGGQAARADRDADAGTARHGRRSRAAHAGAAHAAPHGHDCPDAAHVQSPLTILEQPLVSFGREICGRSAECAAARVAGHQRPRRLRLRHGRRRQHPALPRPAGRGARAAGGAHGAGRRLDRVGDLRRPPLPALHARVRRRHDRSPRLSPSPVVCAGRHAAGLDLRAGRRAAGAARLDGARREHHLRRAIALLRASRPLDLEITPLVTYRDFHSLSRGSGWQPGVQSAPAGIEVRAFDGAVPYRLLADGAALTRRSATGTGTSATARRPRAAWTTTSRPLRARHVLDSACAPATR